MAKILVLGYGNPARLDDGLGPVVAEALERQLPEHVTVSVDYQLTIEDATEVAQHEVIVFVDASVSGRDPFYFERVTPLDYLGVSTHSLSPGALLGLAETCFGTAPQGYVLGIRGYEFGGFGEVLSEQATLNSKKALSFLLTLIEDQQFDRAVAEHGNQPE